MRRVRRVAIRCQLRLLLSDSVSHIQLSWETTEATADAGRQFATTINVMKPVDEKSFAGQTVERTADGKLLPNIDEILIVRR